MPNRFGPTRLGPPFSKVWQAWHFLAAAAPFSTEAVCRSFSIGSDGAAAASLAPPSVSFTAISKPGFAGIWGENSASAVKFVTRSTRQLASTAPIILLSSKESILDQAPGRKDRDDSGWSLAAGRPPESPGIRKPGNWISRTAPPSGQGDIGLPVLWQPVYMRRISTTPIN